MATHTLHIYPSAPTLLLQRMPALGSGRFLCRACQTNLYRSPSPLAERHSHPAAISELSPSLFSHGCAFPGDCIITALPLRRFAFLLFTGRGHLDDIGCNALRLATAACAAAAFGRRLDGHINAAAAWRPRCAARTVRRRRHRYVSAACLLLMYRDHPPRTVAATCY